MVETAAHQVFRAQFGGNAELVASAPGRVNLIGEHTDYHEGFVLPTVIPQRTATYLRKRADRAVRASSAVVNAGAVRYALGSEVRSGAWWDYIQGITATLTRSGFELPGFDLYVQSDVPAGAGVSSSAALGVALLRGLRALAALALDDVDIARVVQASENGFIGAPVGIMDPMACSLGRDGEALFLDTRTLAFERIPFDTLADLVVIDSGIAHQHASGDYRTRRDESFAAAKALGVPTLRDAGVAMLPRIADQPSVLVRRARHVVSENQRVRDAVAALRSRNMLRFGTLLNESHASMRDDYEISTSEVDALVALGQSHSDVYGARMTGGGFGGAVVMLVHCGCARAVAQQVTSSYVKETARSAVQLVPPVEADFETLP